MKATGIVRRIDDLGRIVIPKEIRRTLRLRDAEPLEIFTDRNGEIVLKKYSPIGELSNMARGLAEAAAQVTGHTVCISDQDVIISAAGSGWKDYFEKPISKEAEKIIRERKTISGNEGQYYPVTEQDQRSSQILVPIICAGDAVGAVMILGKKERVLLGETELGLAQILAGYLGNILEE